MLGGNKLWALVLSLCFVFMMPSPAFAADPQITKEDLKGIKPENHKYLFALIGGAAVGAGIGALLGGGNDITKGLMVGGGGMSALYLHSHRRDSVKGWRNWAYIASYTAFGGGMGWALCGCNDGLVSGMLIGGGATTAWLVSHPQTRPRTASGPRP